MPREGEPGVIGFVKRAASKVAEFLGEVKAEMIKVAWPTREEIVASTWVVIIGVFFVAVWIFLSDSVSQTVITTLVGILR